MEFFLGVISGIAITLLVDMLFMLLKKKEKVIQPSDEELKKLRQKVGDLEMRVEFIEGMQADKMEKEM